MIPNKPSILVAPNGSGKSSLAFAFQWLNKQRLKLNEDDAYEGNTDNKPELIIITDEANNNLYKADENRNDISKRFGIFVINKGLKASIPGQYNGILMGKSTITIPDIELLRSIPNNVNMTDDFDKVYDIRTSPRGLFPSIKTLLSDNYFMALCDYEQLKLTNRQINKIVSQLELIKTYKGTIEERYSQIAEKNRAIIEQIASIQYVEKILKRFCAGDKDVVILLKAIRLVTLAYRKSNDFKKHVAYANYKTNEDRIKKMFGTLKTTWKNIKPRKDHDKLILRIGDAQRISNGERDILILVGMLQKARNFFTKLDNILLIDEVFDYLDDANLIAAQHYVNSFIKELKDEGKTIYPIILSHLNPIYFRTFAFRDMKVYYLNPLQYPNASDNMIKLVRKRDEWEKQDKEKADLISKYMLHFHPDTTIDMKDIIGMKDPDWGDISTFKKYCINQLDEYLCNRKYDSLAVCVALREMIEKYCYQRLKTDEQKRIFLDETFGTENKLNYVENLNVVLPETFSLLGLVYNDPLHPNNKNMIDLKQTLYSRLENNTIRGMVEEIKNYM